MSGENLKLILSENCNLVILYYANAPDIEKQVNYLQCKLIDWLLDKGNLGPIWVSPFKASTLLNLASLPKTEGN